MLAENDEGSCYKLGQSGCMIRPSFVKCLLHMAMTLGFLVSDNSYVIDLLLHVIAGWSLVTLVSCKLARSFQGFLVGNLAGS